MHYLFSFGLFIHIIGITLIAGGSIGGLLLEVYCWKLIRQSPGKVSVVGPIMKQYPMVIQVGTILMLISGLMMLGALGWAVAGEWWFIIKMILVVALVLNGSFVAGPNNKKMFVLVGQLLQGHEVQAKIKVIKNRLIAFHISEMALLLIVYLLAIFRFGS